MIIPTSTRLFGAAIVLWLLTVIPAHAQTGSTPADVASFLGRWDLTIQPIQAQGKELPSWIEILQKDGRLQANFVGRWAARGRFRR